MFVHSKLAWQVTMVFGLQSMNAYAARAWLPTIMLDKGFTMANAGSAVALAGLLGAVAAMAVPHIAQRMTDQRPALWFISLLCGASFLGVLYGSHSWVIFWVCMSQVGQWCSYPLALLLIILRSPNADQAQSLSAMVQTIGYTMGAVSPLLAGSLFEMTGQWTASLWVLCVIAIAQALAGHGAGRIGQVRRRGMSEDEMLIAEVGTA
jgi:CP family cyanate transporter-like MFS transporter